MPQNINPATAIPSRLEMLRLVCPLDDYLKTRLRAAPAEARAFCAKEDAH